ncbi:amino acid kinase family protein [Treponema sp. R6D11]
MLPVFCLSNNIKKRVLKMKIIIKVGTTTAVKKNGKVNKKVLKSMAKSIKAIRRQGHYVIIVASGAVGCAEAILKNANAKTWAEKSALSSVGQITLMEQFRRILKRKGIVAGQNLYDSKFYENEQQTRHILSQLNSSKEMGILTIVNANDATGFEKSDNDVLASHIAREIGADKLIFIADEDGFRRKNADGSLGDVIDEISHDKIDEYAFMAGGAKSERSSGGMRTKVLATKNAKKTDIHIVSNKRIKDIGKLISGSKRFGTIITRSIT